MAKAAVLWARDEHTRAKHELLLAFFNKWISIHSGYFAGRPGGGLVRIYDGFAGPGIYSGGEPGLPLVLMNALCANPNLHERWSGVRYELTFVRRARPGRTCWTPSSRSSRTPCGRASQAGATA